MNITGPILTTDESRLRQLENLIAQGREAERVEAARKAEEERLRREREASAPSYTLDQLEAKAAELRAQIAQQQHHLKVEAERDVLQRRAERLAADIEVGETKLAGMRAEHAVLVAKVR